MSKKRFGKVAAVLMAIAMSTSVGLLAGCNDNTVNPNPTPIEEDTPTSYLDSLDDYRAYRKSDLADVLGGIGTVDGGSIDAAVKAAYDDGVSAIEAATSVSAVESAFDAAKTAMAECIPLADGTYDYTSLSYEEKTKILGILEKYAINAGLTGTTLFEDGGYEMFNERVTLGTENYIPGYGFGTLAEGSLTADLDTESNAAWKRYYHTYMSADEGTANYLNSQDSTVGDLYGYIGASYYTNFMNDTKDGYDWVPELAASDVEPLNLNSKTNQASRWRFEVRQDLTYSTLGCYSSEYNGRKVALEDFITPYKLLFNQGNGYYRGGETAGYTGAQAIVGASAYYKKTAEAPKGILSDADYDFSGVAVKAYEENGKWYFEFELGASVTAFYAMYYITSSLYMPVPADFIEKVGVDNYLGFSSDKSTTPVDNSLSLGAYVLEAWNSDQQIVYKKNPNYVFADTKYAIEGVHINILAAANTDTEAGIKEFLAGKIDACGIPQTYLEEYKSDPRTRTYTGSSCFKLNMNALDQKNWEYYFGENGVITQTPKEQYWECEPAMNNSHFRSALSYALNRNAFADIKGSISSVNYFSSNYMSDPENGISYNTTKEHQNAVAQLLDGTDSGGYSLELAREYFRMALDELEAEGKYTPGTTENPTVIEINVFWMYAAHEESYHKYIKQYWEEAFNDESVTGGKYKLEVTFSVGESWSDVYYNAMMVGQYDVAFGSISGNPLNPLNFMSVLSTDASISGSFTLNWSLNTNDPTADILVYDGMRWSYDALYQASQSIAFVNDGVNSAALSAGESSLDLGTDKATVTLTINAQDDGVKIDDLVIFGYIDGTYTEASVMEYATSDLVYADGAYTVTLEIPSSVYASYMAGQNQGIDVYWSYEKGDFTAADSFGFTFSLAFVA